MDNSRETYFVDDWKVNPTDQFLNIDLVCGDHVKIGKTQVFWVFVDRIMSEDTYSGIILDFDNRVIFQKKHIFDHKKGSPEIINT